MVRLAFILLVFNVFQISLGLQKPDCKDVERHPNLALFSSASECGMIIPLPKVMGGHTAQLGEFPWEVIIFAKDTGRFNYMYLRVCGGSLISDKYVLTAAHCIYAFNRFNWVHKPKIYYNMIVRVGEHDLDTDPDEEDGETAPPVVEYEAESWISHPEYKYGLGEYNDIALIRLKDAVVFNDYVSPICLPTTCKNIQANLVGKLTALAGWGRLLDDPVKRTKKLQKVYLRVADSPKQCPYTFVGGVKYPTIDSQMCAGGTAVGMGDRDACSGDSGGPLMYMNTQELPAKYYQAGVVASGELCSKRVKSRSPGIYSRVSYFMPWILDNMKP